MGAMADALSTQMDTPSLQQFSFEDRLGMLVEREWSERENKKLKRLIKGAALPEPANLEDLDSRASRQLDRSLGSRALLCSGNNQTPRRAPIRCCKGTTGRWGLSSGADGPCTRAGLSWRFSCSRAQHRLRTSSSSSWRAANPSFHSLASASSCSIAFALSAAAAMNSLSISSVVPRQGSPRFQCNK